MKQFLAFIITLLGCATYGQSPYIPFHDMLKNLPDELTRYIPKGYAAMDTLSGDLNRDKYTDFIMVLKKTDEDTIFSYDAPRPLLLFTGQPDGTLKFREKNDSVVMCVGCGGIMGDPYMGLSIKNGYFSVEHYGGSGWRWEQIYTFKYSKEDDNWLLHKYGDVSFHAAEPNKTESHIKTKKDFGKVLFKDFTRDE